MREDRDTRLLRYIEGELSPAERQAVEVELDQPEADVAGPGEAEAAEEPPADDSSDQSEQQ